MVYSSSYFLFRVVFFVEVTSLQPDTSYSNLSTAFDRFATNKMLSRIFARRFSAAASGQSAGIVPSNARYKKIQELQNVFCRDDGLMVWQKMGTKDKMMYYTTLLITVGGFIPSVGTILMMSFPKKVE
ncbi:hypothetical protein ACOMHN_064409 [Nucella lapillus]